MESPHSGYNIANLVNEELQYGGITNHIFQITLHTATNNDMVETAHSTNTITQRIYIGLQV